MSEETSTPGEERAPDGAETPDDRAGRLAEITAELAARSQEQDDPSQQEQPPPAQAGAKASVAVTFASPGIDP